MGVTLCNEHVFCQLISPFQTRSFNGLSTLQTGLYLSPATKVSTVFLRPHWHNAKPAPHYLRGMNNWLMCTSHQNRNFICSFLFVSLQKCHCPMEERGRVVSS